jgi:prepilin-type N-terminal cleavage/methylation domain-containing protein/prepilin-type processing-associated H-X9-DG protein
MDSKRKNRRGFTLVEILVVVLIIVILMGLLFPAINAARESARAAQCINNQQELGKALIQYDMTKNRLPGVLSFINPSSTSDPNPRKVNWVMNIFGELGRMDIWQDWNKPDLSNGTPVYGTTIKVAQLICPSNSMAEPVGGLSYAVNLGVYQNDASENPDYSVRLFRNRAALDTSTPPKSEPDQTITSLKTSTRTVMLSERLQASLWTYAPAPTTSYTPGIYSTDTDPLAFQWPPASSTKKINDTSSNQLTDPAPVLGSNHRGMINVTFCDGHTEKIPEITACWNDPDNPLYGVP